MGALLRTRHEMFFAETVTLFLIKQQSTIFQTLHFTALHSITGKLHFNEIKEKKQTQRQHYI